MEYINKLFLSHPKEDKMTYIQHFLNTFFLGTYLGFNSVKIIIHSIFPFLFINCDNDCIKYSDNYINIVYNNI